MQAMPGDTGPAAERLTRTAATRKSCKVRSLPVGVPAISGPFKTLPLADRSPMGFRLTPAPTSILTHVKIAHARGSSGSDNTVAEIAIARHDDACDNTCPWR